MTKDELKTRALEIIDTAKNEVRDLTESEEKEINTIKEEIKEIEDGIEENPIEESAEKVEEKEIEETVDESEEKEENNNNDSNIRKMNTEFRLIKAIRDVANNRNLDEVTKAVANAGAEEMRKSGLSFGGQIQLPLESRTITVTSEHDDVVETEFTNILEPLRAKNV